MTEPSGKQIVRGVRIAIVGLTLVVVVLYCWFGYAIIRKEDGPMVWLLLALPPVLGGGLGLWRWNRYKRWLESD